MVACHKCMNSGTDVFFMYINIKLAFCKFPGDIGGNSQKNLQKIKQNKN